MLSAQARLGHAFIDLYGLAIGRIGSLKLRARDDDQEEGDVDLIQAYLDLLDRQRRDGPESSSPSRSFHRLPTTST